ncbi:uncharacterized protein LOC119610506 [Lucilia sericata]|uniref:uncharacterized protein LOC119610506 n=1 Tax=Lucilia sericata TaxID=13632 RepID=UPI0018A7F98A|nr:uncharacterized protein LOC119610506 [Lucilia sericata]
MEIQIFALLFVSGLASTVVHVSHNEIGNTYDKMYTNKLTVIPKYEYNKFENLFEFGVKQTQHDENVFHKILLNKYVKFEKDDENNSLGSHVSVIEDDYTKKIEHPKNEPLPVTQFKNGADENNIYSKFKANHIVVADSQSIKGTNSNNNTSPSYKSMVYNRVNTNISTFNYQSGNNLIHHIENIKSSKIRRSSEYRNKNISYQSLCPTKRKSVLLETIEYEYRPNHYIEVSCAHSYVPSHANIDDKNKICSEAGFSCMQLNRTIHLIRRNKSKSSQCWESEIRVIPSGCECMWPKHYYGDILAFHESHKRYNAGLMNGYIPYISNNNS